MDDYEQFLISNGLQIMRREILNENCAKTWDLSPWCRIPACARQLDSLAGQFHVSPLTQNTNFACIHMLRMPLSVKSRFRN
jgi:hypothetical protein